MKRILTAALAIALLLCLFSCNETDDKGSTLENGNNVADAQNTLPIDDLENEIIEDIEKGESQDEKTEENKENQGDKPISLPTLSFN